MRRKVIRKRRGAILDEGLDALQQMQYAFLNAVRTGVPAIDPEEIFEVARVTIEAATLLRQQ